MANTNVNGDDYGLFWNSQGGDREYNGDSFEKWLKKFFVSGVFNGDLQVTATSGMGISVASGYANLDGKVMMFDSATPFTLETASASNPRIDTVVVERNETDRAITLKVVTGTPSAEPEPTAPVRTDGVYQLVLAQIYVDTATASISQLDITDTRPITELCGWVASTVTEIDFDSMIAQYNTWFENFKSHLDGDVAIELQLEIDDLNESMGEVEQIPQNFAPIEDTNIASQTYTVGSYLVYNGLLYKVTSAIAQGATLQVGVNIEQTKVGNELTTINNSIGTSIANALSWKLAGTLVAGNGNTLTLPTSNYNEILVQESTDYGTYIQCSGTKTLPKKNSGTWYLETYRGSSSFRVTFNYSTGVFTNNGSMGYSIYYR